MNIVLIGKNGQLGSELETALGNARINVAAFGHKELDIRDHAALRKTIDALHPDIVINASAYHVVPDCEAYPEEAFKTNAFALKHLAQACHRQNALLLTFSTDYVFDGNKGSPYTEDDQPNPLQMYGISKLTGEIITLNYNPRSIVIRTCGVYGGKKGSKSKKGNFILTILDAAKQKNVIEISSEQIVSPTYARDLASATIELLTIEAAPGVYHLVNEGFCAWSEFARTILTIAGSTTHIQPVDRRGTYGRLKRPLFSALANTKAKSLGVILPPWQDAIQKYLHDYPTI